MSLCVNGSFSYIQRFKFGLSHTACSMRHIVSPPSLVSRWETLLHTGGLYLEILERHIHFDGSLGEHTSSHGDCDVPFAARLLYLTATK